MPPPTFPSDLQASIDYAGLDAAVREVWDRERRITPPRVQSKMAAPAEAEEKAAA